MYFHHFCYLITVFPLCFWRLSPDFCNIRPCKCRWTCCDHRKWSPLRCWCASVLAFMEWFELIDGVTRFRLAFAAVVLPEIIALSSARVPAAEDTDVRDNMKSSKVPIVRRLSEVAVESCLCLCSRYSCCRWRRGLLLWFAHFYIQFKRSVTTRTRKRPVEIRRQEDKLIGVLSAWIWDNVVCVLRWRRPHLCCRFS